MGNTLNELANDFHAIRNGDAIDAFVCRYALSQADPGKYPHVRNQLELHIDGVRQLTTEYADAL